MDECEDREEGVPPSQSSLCGEQENQSKAQRNPPGPGPGPGRPPPPPSSCVSLKSDRSKHQSIDFKGEQGPEVRGKKKRRKKKKIHQRPESSGPEPGPRSSCVSFQSDRSKDHPIHFKGEPGPAAERVEQQNSEVPRAQSVQHPHLDSIFMVGCAGLVWLWAFFLIWAISADLAHLFCLCS